LDVTDDSSIAAAVRVVCEAGGLDILVNNAGINVADDAENPREALAALFDVNVFGAVAVTYAFLSVLQRSPAPRIVNVSSDLGSFARATDPESAYYALRLLGYPASKAALNMATVQLAKRLEGTGVRVNAVNPGFTARSRGRRPRGHAGGGSDGRILRGEWRGSMVDVTAIECVLTWNCCCRVSAVGSSPTRQAS
jgi:NAD(P)-dependent dehydrogenase (short-subunit alcohol dehydrogenase family)